MQPRLTPGNQATIARMAADLVRFDAIDSERDAIRSLMTAGYAYGDIVRLFDEARAVARARKGTP